MTCDTSSNIDTQVDTTSFSISDVQQPPAIDEEQAAPEPETGPGSSVNAGTSPEELLADENGACLDPNQNNPHNKTRVRRESPSTDYCPFLLVPESRLIEGPQEPGAGQNEGDGVRRYRPKKPQRFDPLNMPTFQDGETIENPCTRYTLARIPVCDSGYFGPTNNLAECRLCTFIDYSFLEKKNNKVIFLFLFS